MNRNSGILLHISSLPSKYGIGNLGIEAYRFIDFLKSAHQTYWQILPTNPTGYGDSPYQSFSTFAGNPYFIDLDDLIENGWLTQAEVDATQWSERDDCVSYERLYSGRNHLLSLAYKRFSKNVPSDFDAFCARETWWLEDYCLFMAVKSHLGGAPWSEWPNPIRLREQSALRQYRELLRDEIGLHRFIQYIFDRQWTRLHQYAKQNGIRILGDIPIYVPLDSADVWSAPENYQLTKQRHPRCVAGVPPDFFNADGQYWGNPIYDWKRMEQDGFSWWLRRIGAAVKRYDAVRIDHFRGISSYWCIPARNKTARRGFWIEGPGMKLVSAIQSAYPDAEFVAEDLGFLTPEVHELVRDSQWPGMKVLQFAFDPSEPSIYLPHKYDENCICYTGTHDNETLCQWADSLSAEAEEYTRDYLKISETEDLPQAIICAGMQSKAKLFIAQMQDYLRLGSDARMNEPGYFKMQNWSWRMLPNALNERLSAQISELTIQADRG